MIHVRLDLYCAPSIPTHIGPEIAERFKEVYKEVYNESFGALTVT